VRRLSLLLFFLGLATGAPAAPVQTTTDTTQWSAVELPAAQQLDLRARSSGRRYRIYVSVPASAAPEAGRPVLYVLDGNAAFPVAAFLARSAESRREVTGQVAPIVVGIGYPDATDFDVAARARDYTPGAGETDASAKEGGAARFLDFIERDLKPMIAAKYPVDPQRQALFGHSYGGLFVLHVLFTRPGAFSTYLASSPSIWWQDKRVLVDLPGFVTGLAAQQPPQIQISVGALEDAPRKGKVSAETRALLARRTMVADARALAAQLISTPGWGDRVRYLELEGEDHGTAWLPAMARGMRLFLEQP